MWDNILISTSKCNFFSSVYWIIMTLESSKCKCLYRFYLYRFNKQLSLLSISKSWIFNRIKVTNGKRNIEIENTYENLTILIVFFKKIIKSITRTKKEISESWKSFWLLLVSTCFFNSTEWHLCVVWFLNQNLEQILVDLKLRSYSPAVNKILKHRWCIDVCVSGTNWLRWKFILNPKL